MLACVMVFDPWLNDTYRGLAATALQHVQFVYTAMLVVRLCYSLAQHAYTYGVSTLRWLHLTDRKNKFERLDTLTHISDS